MRYGQASLATPRVIAQFASFQLTVWGVPAEPANNHMRGVYCHGSVGDCGGPGLEPEGYASTSPDIPYLTSPTQCSGSPLQAELSITSYESGVAPDSTLADTGVIDWL